MGRAGYRSVLVWSLIGASALVGAILIVAFMLNERRHEDQAFAYNTERKVDDLLRSQLQHMAFQGPGGSQDIPDEIEVFALYDRDGEILVSWGAAPGSIETGNFLGKTEGRSMIDLGRGLYELRRRLDSPGSMKGMGRRNRGAEVQGYLLARIRVEESGLPGSVRGILLVLMPVLWVVLLIVVGMLISRQRRLAETLAHNRELLQYAEAGRTLAHEVRNPLAAIMLQTALMRRMGQKALELDVIDQEAGRINDLVAKVREFFKDPRGEPELLNIWQKILEIKGNFSVELQLTPQIDPGYLLRFDPVRLRSVLENLIRNAIESTEAAGAPPGTPIRVELALVRGRMVRIEVLDRGTGFDGSVEQHLFTPFFTTKIQGSGIGLAMSRRFVETAGGSLELENREGGGASAIINLPLGAKL